MRTGEVGGGALPPPPAPLTPFNCERIVDRAKVEPWSDDDATPRRGSYFSFQHKEAEDGRGRGRARP